jgi:hypothetical protein
VETLASIVGLQEPLSRFEVLRVLQPRARSHQSKGRQQREGGSYAVSSVGCQTRKQGAEAKAGQSRATQYPTPRCGAAAGCADCGDQPPPPAPEGEGEGEGSRKRCKVGQRPAYFDEAMGVPMELEESEDEGRKAAAAEADEEDSGSDSDDEEADEDMRKEAERPEKPRDALSDFSRADDINIMRAAELFQNHPLHVQFKRMLKDAASPAKHLAKHGILVIAQRYQQLAKFLATKAELKRRTVDEPPKFEVGEMVYAVWPANDSYVRGGGGEEGGGNFRIAPPSLQPSNTAPRRWATCTSPRSWTSLRRPSSTLSGTASCTTTAAARSSRTCRATSSTRRLRRSGPAYVQPPTPEPKCASLKR